MRWLLTGLAFALIASGLLSPAPEPAYAASPIIGEGVDAPAIPMVGPDRIEKTSKKKKKKKNKNDPGYDTTPTLTFSQGPGPVLVTIDPLKDPRRNELSVFVQAVISPVAAYPVTHCSFLVRYRFLGDVVLGNVAPTVGNVCVFRFNAPSDAKVVGGAGLIVTAYSSPTVVGQGTQGFIVKPQ